jgi:hypothetical protein
MLGNSDTLSGFEEPSWVRANALQYTVVETTRGFLYLVLVPQTGNLLYDVRTAAPTREAAEEALRRSLGEEPSLDREQDHLLVYVSPDTMLGMMMTLVVLRESKGPCDENRT